jgi:hypothetical protein
MKKTLLIAAIETEEEKISLFKIRLALSPPLRVILSVVVTSRMIGQLPVAVSCVPVSKKMRLCGTTARQQQIVLRPFR